MAQRLILQTVITSAIDLVPQGGGALDLIHTHGPQGATHKIRLGRDQALALAESLTRYAKPAQPDANTTDEFRKSVT